jgi:hypothetical protein
MKNELPVGCLVATLFIGIALAAFISFVQFMAWWRVAFGDVS